MKAYLAASMSALVLAAGIAGADTVAHPKALKKVMPDCPAGFVKTDVALGDFTCTTRQIVCPAILGSNVVAAMHDTEAMLIGTTGVQFSFRCTYHRSGK